MLLNQEPALKDLVRGCLAVRIEGRAAYHERDICARGGRKTTICKKKLEREAERRNTCISHTLLLSLTRTNRIKKQIMTLGIFFKNALKVNN